LSFAFVLFILVSSVLCQEIGLEERVHRDMFYGRVGRKTLMEFLNSVEILTPPTN